MEDERIESDLCVGDGELAVCDREDRVIIGDVKSWWGSAVGVGSIMWESLARISISVASLFEVKVTSGE